MPFSTAISTFICSNEWCNFFCNWSKTMHEWSNTQQWKICHWNLWQNSVWIVAALIAFEFTKSQQMSFLFVFVLLTYIFACFQLGAQCLAPWHQWHYLTRQLLIFLCSTVNIITIRRIQVNIFLRVIVTKLISGILVFATNEDGNWDAERNLLWPLAF